MHITQPNFPKMTTLGKKIMYMRVPKVHCFNGLENLTKILLTSAIYPTNFLFEKKIM